MFGETIQKNRPQNLRYSDQVVLEVKDLCRREPFRNSQLSLLRKGEILGHRRDDGVGQDRAAAGHLRASILSTRGRSTIDGMAVKAPYSHAHEAAGGGHAPEKRKKEGHREPERTRQHVSRQPESRIASGISCRRNAKSRFVRQADRKAGIKVADPKNPISSLSGGNQQKVVSVNGWTRSRSDPASMSHRGESTSLRSSRSSRSCGI